MSVHEALQPLVYFGHFFIEALQKGRPSFQPFFAIIMVVLWFTS